MPEKLDAECVKFSPDRAFGATRRLLNGMRDHHDFPLDEADFVVMPFFQGCVPDGVDSVRRLNAAASAKLKALPRKVEMIWIAAHDYGRCLFFEWGLKYFSLSLSLSLALSLSLL